MTFAASLIPGLDEFVKHGDPKRRAEAARRIAELFLLGAANFRPDHVDLFDGVLIDLVPHTELAARADLAERLSVLANAPRALVGQLAREDEIMNAGPLFSQAGYSALIKRAGQDGVLTLAIGQREDLSGQQLKDLLAGSIDVVRRRLFKVVKPSRQADIELAMEEISGVPERVESRRDFAPAQRTILALHNAGELNEAALFGFAKAHKYEESVVALSAMSAVKIATLDRLIAGDRHDPILIVGRAVGLEWATVRALILLRLGPSRVPAPAHIEGARVNRGRPPRSDPDRRQGDRPRMGHRARPDPASARSQPGAGSRAY